MKLAVVQIKGVLGTTTEIRDTLQMLNLKKRNNCVIVEDTPSVKGMLKKAMPMITWGEINEETLKELKKKKAKKTFTLNPPRKGYGRKGIKMPFKKGGAYGDRKEKINDLIMRML